eukprot:comp7324_c0_seq1/m.3020 comp7324_c0_seq1/g.3020  ORF comp7324_c0_seq1/g.3020 comp7324_c0_seq1/m.3020 type:complete len:234 (-) comp7324_c0_seq1:160-861(-)
MLKHVSFFGTASSRAVLPIFQIRVLNLEYAFHSGSSKGPSGASKSENSVQSLRHMLRPLLLRVHPDRFADRPDLRRANETALSDLNGILDGLQRRQLPSTLPIKLRFYLRHQTGSEEEIKEVATSVDLKTVGGRGPVAAVREAIRELLLVSGLQVQKEERRDAGSQRFHELFQNASSVPEYMKEKARKRTKSRGKATVPRPGEMLQSLQRKELHEVGTSSNTPTQPPPKPKAP